MSLTVYLMSETPVKRGTTGSGIFIRQEGATVEVTREQWDAIHPGIKPIIMQISEDDESLSVFDANITHNLGKMAAEAGLYKALWRPEEIGAVYAKDIFEVLALGIDKLEKDPEHFKKFNPPNGWGTYEQLLNFSIGYKAACEQWPDARIEVLR